RSLDGRSLDGRSLDDRSLDGADRDLDASVAEPDRIAVVELGLVDPLVVDERTAGRSEIDELDVVVAVDLDARVHATDGLVVEAEVRGWHLAELDHALGQRLFADQTIVLEDSEREWNFRNRHEPDLRRWRACAGHPAVPRSPQAHMRARRRGF